MLYALVGVTMVAGGATRIEPPSDEVEYQAADFRRHPFEKDLLIYSPKVPFLTQAEWTEIKAQFAEKKDYDFHGAVRESEELVRVYLDKKGDKPALQSTELFFEKKNGHWIENKEKEVISLRMYD